jgi:glycosyltransferase involved in cell wall biosynthesis
VRVLYFGTYDRAYPRNAQVISALRRTGVEVAEHHVAVWDGRRDNWRAGPAAAARLAAAELRLLRSPRGDYDVIVVGYPGHLDLRAAQRTARGRPVIFNPLVSLFDTFVGDRERFRPGSVAARLLRAIDADALRRATVVVADTATHADYFADLGTVPRDRLEVCFVGAEERVFRAGWSPEPPFTALFVGKLIPLHGVETVLAAARRLPVVAFRLVGTGQLENLLASRPPNAEWQAWVEYERLPNELHRAGCALGIFGTSPKAQRVIPNKAYQALACGTPLVTADTRGARELLADGDTALLVPPGDAAALAAAVRRLASDAELARRLSSAGRAVYEARASEQVLGRCWLDVLERVAG